MCGSPGSTWGSLPSSGSYVSASVHGVVDGSILMYSDET